jgi:BolA protein
LNTSDLSATVMQALQARLAQAFEPQTLEVRDDSAAHAGHAGARSGGHYAVHIVASRFDGLGLLARHRLVYAAVADLMQDGIHALQIDAKTPEET